MTSVTAILITCLSGTIPGQAHDYVAEGLGQFRCLIWRDVRYSAFWLGENRIYGVLTIA